MHQVDERMMILPALPNQIDTKFKPSVASAIERNQAILRHVEAGRALIRNGDPTAAMMEINQALALDPKHVGALGDMVIVLHRQGRIQQAVKAARAALAVAPENPNLLAQLGHLLNQRTNYVEAEANFQAALTLDPKHPGALGGLASTYMRRGQGEAALALLETATTCWPKNAGMHVRHGQVLEEHHRLAAAAVAYGKAAAINAEHPLAKAGLLRVRNPRMIFERLETLLKNPDDLAALGQLGAELSITDDALAALIRFARNPRKEDIASIAQTPLEYEVLLSMADAAERRQFWLNHGRAAPLRRLREAPEATDVLAEPASHESWIPAQWLSFSLLRKTQPINRAAVVVAMRDEGLYIVEWVAHYRALGFDTIFVYSNDNIDGSDGLLRELARHGLITYIENRMGDGNNHPQRKAYAHALHLVPELWEHEWVLFADSDEFLIPDQSYGFQISALIDDAVRQHPARGPSAITFNWFWCVGGFEYAYEPGLLLRRFPHGLPKRGMKSMVRLRDIFSMHLIHFPEMDHEGFLVRADFKRLEKAMRHKRFEPVYTSARLNHYWNKSFEEFSLKKARGDAAGNRDKLWKRGFELFFTKDAEETADNYAPVPESLVSAVEAEVKAIKALAGIENHLTEIRARLPVLLGRFDSDGGLRAIYDTMRGQPNEGAAEPGDTSMSQKTP